MNKSKLLTFAVILLVVINLTTLFLVMRKGPRHPGEGPKRVIIEKLHFDAEQQKQYEKLIHWHRRHIDTLDQQIRETKNLLYRELLYKSPNLQTHDSLIDAISNYQKNIEEIHFRHFQDIRNICKPEQIQDYNQLTEELTQLFSKPRRPKHE